MYVYIYIYIYFIYIYIYIYIYIDIYIWYSREKALTFICFARWLLQLSQTFSPVTFHFSIKFTEIFYYSLIQTTSKRQCTRLGK